MSLMHSWKNLRPDSCGEEVIYYGFPNQGIAVVDFFESSLVTTELGLSGNTGINSSSSLTAPPQPDSQKTGGQEVEKGLGGTLLLSLVLLLWLQMFTALSIHTPC